jgi:hypothetical protein
MDGEFFNMAAEIADIASRDGISVTDIGRIVGEVNCYPGTTGASCHRLSFFISIKGKMAKGYGHLNFSEMLDAFVAHMQGRCPGITRHAVIITNAWEYWSYEKWYSNIEAVKRDGVHVEAYLIGMGGHVSKIDI